jgi:hypothetical protein
MQITNTYHTLRAGISRWEMPVSEVVSAFTVYVSHDKISQPRLSDSSEDY